MHNARGSSDFLRLTYALLSSAKRLLPGREPQRACMKRPKASGLHSMAKAPSKAQGDAQQRGRAGIKVPLCTSPHLHVGTPAWELSPAAAAGPSATKERMFREIFGKYSRFLFVLLACSAAVTWASTPLPSCSTGGPQGSAWGLRERSAGPGVFRRVSGAAPLGACSPRGCWRWDPVTRPAAGWHRLHSWVVSE